MSTYPTLGQTTQSREDYETGVVLERASNGTLRGRQLWAGAKLKLTLVHVCERADVDALLAFYAANVVTPVDVLYDGDNTTHSMMFDGKPVPQPLGGSIWRVTSNLVEV